MKRIAIESWDASPDESAFRVRWGRTVLLDNERDYSRAVAALNAAEACEDGQEQRAADAAVAEYDRVQAGPVTRGRGARKNSTRHQ